MEVAILAGQAMEAGADRDTHEAVERMWYALTKRQIGGSKTEAYRDIFYALKSARTFAKLDVNPTPTDEERAARLVAWLPCKLTLGAARSIIAAKRRPLTALVREVLLQTSREERKRLGFKAVPKQAEITTALRKHVELG